MAAYVISEVEMLDETQGRRYRELAAGSIARHGGRYLVRGGPIETLEGGWTPRTIIVVEFADLDRARAWYRSPEYASALEVRDAALGRNLILVDGIGAP